MMRLLLGLFTIVVVGVEGEEVKGGPCPPSHPYVYARGSHCCAVKKERYDAEKFSRCDGSALSFESACCAHHASVACPQPPCRDFKPCVIKSIRPTVPLKMPEYKGSEVVGIATGGSCTGSGEADLSLSHAKSVEEKVEVALTDRQDVDWEKSSTLNLVGMPAFWSFGAMIGGAWTWGKGGKRSVTETRTKSTGTSITSSAGNTSPYKIPGAGILMATARKYEIDRSDVPVEVRAMCRRNLPTANNCIHPKRNLDGKTLRQVFNNAPTGRLNDCVKACENDVKCAAASYVEYWCFGMKSRCKLKEPGYKIRNCALLTKCTSVEIKKCTSGTATDKNEYDTRYTAKMDFKAFSYASVHFTPANSGTKLKKCNPGFLQCIKHIPDRFNHFFGNLGVMGDLMRNCKSEHGVRNG